MEKEMKKSEKLKKPAVNGENVKTGKSSKTGKSIWEDARFQHLITDPRFKNISKAQRKVIIDDRFKPMFTNEKFKVKYTVDKYGRRIDTSTTEDLKKFYELNSSDEENEEREKEEKAILESSDTEGDVTNDDKVLSKNKLHDRLLDPNIDYARGEGREITDSSDDESSEDDDNDSESQIEHVWGELDNEAETTNESTYRLAVCNMDWDRIRAVDLMVLFNSFLPPGGSVLSIKIYPSEYGKQRMTEEEMHGPQELISSEKSKCMENSNEICSDDSDDSDNIEEDQISVVDQNSDIEEGDEYHREKLRKYQLNRLKYYYAVLECDSLTTADKIYRECDGIEYESSATRVDLRFIPNDTTFDESEVTDCCTEMPDINNYKPRQFTNTALQQVKVDLTWDETAMERKELGDQLMSGKLENINDKDLRKILAYSSEEEDNDDDSDNENEDAENSLTEEKLTQNVINTDDKISSSLSEKKSKKKDEKINKYKALLAEIGEKERKEKEEKKYEMEFTWGVNDNKNNEKNDSLDQKKNANLIPIERVKQKRAERNKKRKERKKRFENKDETMSSDLDSIPDDIDMNDPYFAEEFANGDFIDPKIKLKEKKKKLLEQKIEEEQENEKQAKELELLLDDDKYGDRGKQHFSLEKIIKAEQNGKTKKKKRKQLEKSKQFEDDNFQINVNDERFTAVYNSHNYNIDPTDSHFKRTKGMEQLIQEKLKRREQMEREFIEDESTSNKKPKKQIENNLLVKSLKRKLQMNSNN